MTDIICGGEEPTFLYLEENIFGIWPQEIIWRAIDELAEAEIMFIEFIDEDDEEMEEECECEMLLFDSDFVQQACPMLKYCPCCNPGPVSFNVNYN